MTNPAKNQTPRPPRFQAGVPARIEIDGKLHDCRADNLSRKGALLIGRLPNAKGSVCLVALESARGDLAVSFESHVHRQTLDPDSGESTVGVEFLRLYKGTAETLESLIQRAMEGGTPSWTLAELPANATVPQIQAALEGIPLPHRIQLAARGMPRERGMLMKDSHLQVLDALARNPNLLLHELMTLLRMPNLLPHTLDAISKDSRWSGSDQVRLLLAAHRNTTFGVAQRIVSSLPAASLKKLLRMPGLKPAIHAGIVRRLGPGSH